MLQKEEVLALRQSQAVKNLTSGQQFERFVWYTIQDICHQKASRRHACIHARTHARTHTRMHVRTHVRTRARIYTIHTCTQELESVKDLVIKTTDDLLVNRDAHGLDVDTVVDSVRQNTSMSKNVLGRYDVDLKLILQEYLDQKRRNIFKEATGQGDVFLSQSADNIEACSQEGDVHETHDLVLNLSCQISHSKF